MPHFQDIWWKYFGRIVKRRLGYNIISQCCKTTSKALGTTGYLVISLILTRGSLGLVSVCAQTRAPHMCRLFGGETGRRTRLAAALARFRMLHTAILIQERREGMNVKVRAEVSQEDTFRFFFFIRLFSLGMRDILCWNSGE